VVLVVVDGVAVIADFGRARFEVESSRALVVRALVVAP
jgi:hypothetical protein